MTLRVGIPIALTAVVIVVVAAPFVGMKLATAKAEQGTNYIVGSLK